MSKLKALADDNLNVTNIKIFLFFQMVENLVGKGENAGKQHFLLFPPRFSKSLISMFVKSRDGVERVTYLCDAL